MSLFLGIDIGTSGVRTAVLDDSGSLISTARADHLPQTIDHINAENWWIAASDCIRRQMAALSQAERSGAEIARIAVDGTSGSMVLTDAELRPVTRALMYNSKGFHAEAALIETVALPGHITLGSNSALARAMRLVEEDVDGRGVHLLHQADFIAAKLIGHGGYSDHNNALKTGFDPQTEQWPDWIGKVIDPALLPTPVAVGTQVGTIKQGEAQRFGLSPSAVVCAGTTDSIAAFLAAAPSRRGVAVTSLGSTLAVKLLSPSRIDDAAIGLYAHRLGEHWLVGGASNTGGAVLSHYFSVEELNRLSAAIDPATSTGLDYYPLLQPGERFPINDPELSPRLTPRPEDDAVFLQAMFEGIAAIEARCYREIERRGGGYPEIVYSAGGGARNPVFNRIRASALGLMPMTPEQDEAAIGAARIAAGEV